MLNQNGVLNLIFASVKQILMDIPLALHSRMRMVLRRSAKLPLFALNALWVIPLLLLFRIIRPWLHVRMGILESSRIGHFVADPSIFLARRALQSRDEHTFDLLFLPEPSCNKQWARMVRQHLVVHPCVRYLERFNRYIPGAAFHNLPLASLTGNYAVYSPLQSTSVRLAFASGDEIVAKAWLRRRGWQEGEPFVCLAIRDSAYLSSHPTLNVVASADRWSYHDYRDSDIDTCVEAVQALVEMNYWVIRMGKVSHKPLSYRHNKVIDYPFVEDQDDLMDIWLSANCHMFISTSTGIDTIALIYGRPIVFINALPFVGCVPPFNNNVLCHLWVPKHLSWKHNGSPLKLKEYCQHNYQGSLEYEHAGVAIEDLSSTEITSAVMECERRVAGAWVETDEDRDRQRRFWDVMRNDPGFNSTHDGVHPDQRIGSAWLKSMGGSFLE